MRLGGDDIFVLAGRELESVLFSNDATPLFSVILASWWLESNGGESEEAQLLNNLTKLKYQEHLQGLHVEEAYGLCKLPYPSMFPSLFWQEIQSGKYEGYEYFLDAPEKFIHHIAKYGYTTEKPQAYLNKVLVAEQSEGFREVLRDIYSPWWTEL